MISIYSPNNAVHCKEFCDGFKEGNQTVKGMADWIEKRKNSLLSNDNINLPENNARRAGLIALGNLLTRNEIKNILRCPPSQLMAKSGTYSIYNQSKIFVTDGGEIKDRNVLRSIFNYSEFRKHKSTFHNGYTLAIRLSIKCCPYCNRNYTTQHETLFYAKNEVTNKTVPKHIFPEFDHFYSKEINPVIAVSFYNLIPSCNICNSHYKGDRNTAAFNLFHPYLETCANHFSFKFIPLTVGSLYGAGSAFALDFEYRSTRSINNQVKKSIDFFGIKDNYEKCHANLIREIVGKKLMFSNNYLKTIQDTYKISFEESYRLLFETYYEEDKLHQRPFSKLKKDIFDDVNIK